MATFTMALSGSGVVNGTKTWTVSDADVQHLLDYLASVYPSTTPPTNQQALLFWVQGFVTETVMNVKAFQVAQTTVAPIVFT